MNMATVWLVEALTRAGRLDEARLTFERVLSFASPPGFYAEETGPSGEALGDYSQAFTHLALISAAVDLDRALGDGCWGTGGGGRGVGGGQGGPTGWPPPHLGEGERVGERRWLAGRGLGNPPPAVRPRVGVDGVARSADGMPALGASGRLLTG